MIVVIVLGLILGLVIGTNLPYAFSLTYSLYISVAILAGIDSVFGAIRANIEDKFDSVIFFSGFIVNTIMAGVLAYIGDVLGIPLYYAAIFAFGTRLFQNIAIIRRDIIKKMRKEM